MMGFDQGYLMLEATPLPTEPQPMAFYFLPRKKKGNIN